MNKKYVIAANWKMNKRLDDAIQYSAENFDALTKLSDQKNIKLVICPSFISLYPMCKIFKDTNVSIGAQNCSNFTEGNYTGQVSARSIHEAGCKYCIIGHSECRKHLCENNNAISEKLIHLIDFDINPIICIGETKEEYDNKKTIDSLKTQLTKIIQNLNTMLIPEYITPSIAYEPLWAIGSGDIPNTDHLEMVFAFLKDIVKNLKSNIKVNLLYGGSVNSKNVEHFERIDNIEGLLIGNASLNFKELQTIILKLQ